ncbi:MAG: DUF4010 domain-containing protein [Acidimicrobiia bacterium]|nr:DUF4010 domain-containing protein [Acidimicrobiia bacterium]
METSGEVVVAFLAAAGLGVLVGLQRQLGRQHESIYAGARTFAFYAMWGVGAGFLGDRYGTAAFVVAAAGFVAVVVAGYAVGSRHTGDWGTTTEAAAFAVFVTGVLAWESEFVAATAVAIGSAALLQAKEFLHSVSERFSEEDVTAVLQFGVITAVVLPLVPNEDLGPFGAFNPFEIWLMVVLVSAIGLIGYASLRILGERGLGLTGLAGGLVSSTAVTLGFSRLSKEAGSLRTMIAAGIIGASALMYPRVLIEARVVAPELAAEMVVPLVGLGIAVGGIAGFWLLRPDPRADRAESDVKFTNPLTLGIALQFGALYGVVVFAAKAVIDRVSESSLLVVGAVSGILDADAITLSMANLVRDGLDPAPAARAVMAAVAMNTVAKAGLVFVLGSAALRRAVGAVLVSAAIIAAASIPFI